MSKDTVFRDLLLEHLNRYRITTHEVVTRLFFATQKHPEAAAKTALARLRPDYIDSALLFATGRTVYYHLTPAGAAYLKIPPSAAGPVPTDDLRARHYATLLFCCQPGTARHRFTAREFDAFLPGLRDEGTELRGRFHLDTYFLDVDERGDRRLGRVVYSLGTGHPLKPAWKAMKDAEAAFPTLLDEDRFSLAILTATTEKARDIQRQLAREPLRQYPLRVVVHAFDELTEFQLVRPTTPPTVPATVTDA
jgi:hypothetical protein